MMRLTIVLVACISISFYTMHVIDDNTEQKLSDHSGTVVQGVKTSQSRDISSLLENYLKIAQSHNTKSGKASPVHRKLNASLVCASKGKHKPSSDQATPTAHPGPYESDDEEDYSPLVGVTPFDHPSHSDDDVIYYNDRSVVGSMEGHKPLSVQISCIAHSNSGDDSAIYYNDHHVSVSNGKHYPPSDKHGMYTSLVCASKGKHKPPSNQPANTTHPGPYESDDKEHYSPLMRVTPIDHHSHSDDDKISQNDSCVIVPMKTPNRPSAPIIPHFISGDNDAICSNERPNSPLVPATLIAPHSSSDLMQK